MSPEYSKYRDKIIFGSVIIMIFIFSGGAYFLLNYYRSDILDFFGFEKKMRISVIFMETKPQAQAIVKVLDNGSDFAKLAKLYSFGPGKEKGGDLGYIAPGYLKEELDMVALNLKVGEYSGVVETKAGYFILMKIDERYF
jgi:parvulin-like peptidyl-prolyl isomerase